MSEVKPTPMAACEILPIDCWESIFYHLDDDEREAMSLVCKDFLEILNNCVVAVNVFHPEKIGILSKIFNRFKQVKKIIIQFSSGGNVNEAILEIARSDLSLKVLDISFNLDYELKTETFRELGSNPKMKNLKALNFHSDCGINLFNKEDIEVIANSFPNLEELSIKNCSYMDHLHTDNWVEIVASKLNLLKKIHLNGFRINVNDAALVALSLNCAFLKDVSVTCRRDYGATEYGIGFLLRNTPNLEALSIRSIRMDSNSDSDSTITIENSISHAKSLTSLEFERMEVSDRLLIAIAKAKLRLNKFGIQYCDNFTVAGLNMVLSNYNLTDLNIVEAKLVDADMELFEGNIGKISHLVLKQCEVTNSTLFLLSTKCHSLVEVMMDFTALDKQIIEGHNFPLSQNHKVKHMSLSHSEIHDESVKQLGLMFPNLKTLDLSYCVEITSAGIKAILKSCKTLRRLDLKGCSKIKMIEADNSDLPELNLEDLLLTASKIDDEGLSVIAKKCTRLVDLELEFCLNVTTDGIKQIVTNIRSLKYLALQFDPNVSSVDLLEWMLSTGNLASLKYIKVHKVTDEQREKFLQHGCSIDNQ